MSLRSVAVLAACVLLAACSKINQENYSKLKAGMAKSEVESLLGSPTECSGAIGLTSCTWGDEKSLHQRAVRRGQGDAVFRPGAEMMRALFCTLALCPAGRLRQFVRGSTAGQRRPG